MNFNQIKYGRNTTYITGSNRISQLVSAYKTRVLSDGGTFEAEQCMVNNIQSLTNIDIYPVGDAVMIALRNRAVADSGTFEAYNCGIINIQSLSNIDLN